MGTTNTNGTGSGVSGTGTALAVVACLCARFGWILDAYLASLRTTLDNEMALTDTALWIEGPGNRQGSRS